MPEKVYNDIVVVDENDNEIGAMQMPEAIEKGMFRSASIVYVFNESSQVLVQRRGKNVSSSLLLDHSAAGHVDEGETRVAAASRELLEEVGISGFNLIEVESSFQTRGFFNSVYKITVPDTIDITIEKDEVDEVLWMSVDEIVKLVTTAPKECNGSFVEVWTRLKDKLIAA